MLDSETFDMIASKLQFKKKTENVIDSLSVEMTLFKDEIDLYLFLIVMDKYQSVRDTIQWTIASNIISP